MASNTELWTNDRVGILVGEYEGFTGRVESVGYACVRVIVNVGPQGGAPFIRWATLPYSGVRKLNA